MAAMPLTTLDPAAPLDDLEPLAGLIADDVRVVAIGETTHGSAEFYTLRHRLVRFLVERPGFTALVWESGFPEGFLVDAYLQGRETDRARVQRDGITMHLGRCDEMGQLLDWLRTRDGVHFYGLDLPGSGASLLPALNVVGEYLTAADPGFRARWDRLLALASSFGTPHTPERLILPGTAALYQYLALPVAERNELTGLLADLGARFDALRRVYVERSDEANYDHARQHLHVATRHDLQLRAVAALMAGDPTACEANIRDAPMADNVAWVLARHRRVIVLAHNGHIQRTPIATPAGPIDTLGIHLAHRLGNAYLVVGTTCGGGPLIVTRTEPGAHETDLVVRDLPPLEPDSLDALLEPSGLALHDLRTLDAASAAAVDAAVRMRIVNLWTAIAARQAFDLVVHVPRVSLWTSTTNAGLPDLRTPEHP